MTIIARLTPLLDQLEHELRAAELWQSVPPDTSLLASQLPFAIDTLEPHEWLQWIFIENIRGAIEQGNVPRGFALEPYFAEVWKEQDDYCVLLSVIKTIDEVCK